MEKMKRKRLTINLLLLLLYIQVIQVTCQNETIPSPEVPNCLTVSSFLSEFRPSIQLILANSDTPSTNWAGLNRDYTFTVDFSNPVEEEGCKHDITFDVSATPPLRGSADCFAPGTDYPGNDVTNFCCITSVYNCKTKCEANSQCSYFTYNPTSGYCYLKTAKSILPSVNDISGPVTCESTYPDPAYDEIVSVHFYSTEYTPAGQNYREKKFAKPFFSNVEPHLMTVVNTSEDSMSFKFSGLLVNTWQNNTDGMPAVPGPKFYITTGLHIDNDLLWVGVEELGTDEAVDYISNYPLEYAKDSLYRDNDDCLPKWPAVPYATILCTYYVQSLSPSFDIYFYIKELDYNKRSFYFGKPVIEFTGAFSMNKPDRVLITKYSPIGPGGVETTGWIVRYNGVINAHGCSTFACTYKETSTSNQIKIIVPITYLGKNNDEMLYHQKFYAFMRLNPSSVNYTRYFGAMTQITEGSGTISPDVVASISQVECESGCSVHPGGVATFKLSLAVPKGIFEFNFRISCPANKGIMSNNVIFLSSTEYFGFIPRTEEAIQNIFGIDISYNFGNIFNFKENNTLVLRLVISTDSNYTSFSTGENSCSFQLNSGAKEKLNFLVTETPVEPAPITFSLSQIPTGVIYNSETVAVEISIDVPYGVVFKNVLIDVNAGYNTFKMLKFEQIYKGYDVICLCDGLRYRPVFIRQWNSAFARAFYFTVCAQKVGFASPNNLLKFRAILEKFPSNSALTADVNVVLMVDGVQDTKTISITVSNLYTKENRDIYLPKENLCEPSNQRRFWPLENGQEMCLVKSGRTELNRENVCRSIYAEQLELRTRGDWDTIQQLLFDNKGLLTDLVATGAKGIFNANTTSSQFYWQTSGEEARIGTDEFLLTSNTPQDQSPIGENEILYLQMENQGNSRTVFGGFKINAASAQDTAAQFICVRNYWEVFIRGWKQITFSELSNFARITDTLNQPIPIGVTNLLRYSLKISHMIQMPLKFNITTGPQFRVCAVRALHVGENIVNVERSFSGYSSSINSTRLNYLSPSSAELVFDKMANWGISGSSPDMSRDRDGLDIGVFIEVLEAEPFTTSNAIVATMERINYYSLLDQTTKTKTLTAQNAPGVTYNTDLSLSLEVAPVDGSLILTKGMCKRMVVSFSGSSSYRLMPVVENLGFPGGHYVSWCGFYLTKVGLHFPCFNGSDAKPVIFCKYDPYCYNKDSAGTIVYTRSVWMSPFILPHYKYIEDSNEDKVEFEVSMRADMDTPSGTEITFRMYLCEADPAAEFVPPVACSASLKEVEFTLTVADSSPEFVSNQSSPTNPNYLPETTRLTQFHLLQPSLTGCNFEPLKLGVRERGLVCFEINFPFKTVYPTNLTILGKSSANRSALHFHDLRFYNNSGRYASVLGMLDNIDLRSTYRPQFYQLNTTTTMGQLDAVFLDFGLLENPGYYSNWGLNNIQTNTFGMALEVEMADHPESVDQKAWTVSITVNIGPHTLDLDVPVIVNRNATTIEREINFRPSLIIEAKPQTSATKYPISGKTVISTLIYHADSSRGEGYPATVRFLTDVYSSVDITNFTTNYSAGDLNASYLSPQLGAGSCQFQFPNGIMFPDVIELNFTIDFDVFKRRPLTQKNMDSSLIIFATCSPAVFEGFPSTTPTVCSPNFLSTYPLTDKSCDKKLEIEYPDDQIQASYVLSNDTKDSAANILSNNNSWSAPLRTGAKWQYYVDIDFLTRVRITKIKVGFPLNSRGPSAIRVDYSFDTVAFTEGDLAYMSFDNYLMIPKAVVGRVIRLVIHKTNDATPTLKPITMNQVSFYGCRAFNRREDAFIPINQNGQKPPRRGKTTWSFRDRTLYSNNVAQYRHFSVDTAQGFIFVCDRGEYRKEGNCYSANNKGTQWTVLPMFIARIVGYSSERGRTYFTDVKGEAVMSTFDGKRVDVTNTNMAEVANLAGWRPPVLVPGKPLPDLTTLQPSWPDLPVKGDFSGLYYNGKRILNWQSCCLKDP